MPSPLLLGAHLSTSKGLPAMVKTAVELGATCAQIFTASPQMWRGKRYSEAEREPFQAALHDAGIGPIVSHDSYLINLASMDEVILEKSLNGFREEIDRCGVIGLPMVVTHLGSYKGSSLEEGLARLAASLNAIIPLAAEVGVEIVLETTAGQGSYLGGEFEQFPRLFDMIPEQHRLGICLDTCHVYVAGYDIRTQEGYARLWQEFDQHIGLDRLKVIHLNDTNSNLGSHNDRHAGIGQGQIGLEAFRLLMHDESLAHVPKILETPGGVEEHANNLRILRELAS